MISLATASNADEASIATVDELLGGIYPRGVFSITHDGRTMLMPMNAKLQSNGEVALFETEHWAASDCSSDDIKWRLDAMWDHRLLTTPSGEKFVGTANVDGKQWLALRSRGKMEPELLLQIPLDLACYAVGFSHDKKGLLIVIHQGFPVERKKPEEDSPPTEDIKARTRVSPRYLNAVERSQVVKAYPDAFASARRQHFLYLDLQTKQLRRIFSGNDFYSFLVDEGQGVVAVQHKDGARYKNDPSESGAYEDIYTIRIPAVETLPVFELSQARGPESLLAGWFDGAGNRMVPCFKDLRDIRWLVCSPDGQAAIALGGEEEKATLRWFGFADGQTRILSGEYLEPHGPSGIIPRGISSLLDSARPPSLCWAPDGRSAVFVHRGILWRIPTDGSNATKITSGVKGFIRRIVGIDPWSNVAKPTVGGEVVAITADDDRMEDGLARVNLATGEISPLLENAGYISHADYVGDSGTIYYSAIRPDGSVQIFSRLASAAISDPIRQLSDFQSELRGRRIPKRKLIRTGETTGKTGYGILYLPETSSANRPCGLVLVPEGFRGEVFPSLGYEGRGAIGVYRRAGVQGYSRCASFFTKAGFAVLVFDLGIPRRSYDQNIRRTLKSTLEAMIDAAVSSGEINAKEIALYSDGNEMISNFSIIGMTQTDRIGAAVIQDGIGLPIAHALSNDEKPWLNILGITQGVPQKVNPVLTPEVYMDYAAIPLMKTLKTPILFMRTHYQTVDFGPLSTRTDELFNAAEFAGSSNVAIFFKKPVDQGEKMRRTVLWFNEHLRKGPPLAWRATLPDRTANEFNSSSESPEVAELER